MPCSSVVSASASRSHSSSDSMSTALAVDSGCDGERQADGRTGGWARGRGSSSVSILHAYRVDPMMNEHRTKTDRTQGGNGGTTERTKRHNKQGSRKKAIQQRREADINAERGSAHRQRLFVRMGHRQELRCAAFLLGSRLLRCGGRRAAALARPLAVHLRYDNNMKQTADSKQQNACRGLGNEHPIRHSQSSFRQQTDTPSSAMPPSKLIAETNASVRQRYRYKLRLVKVARCAHR